MVRFVLGYSLQGVLQGVQGACRRLLTFFRFLFSLALYFYWRGLRRKVLEGSSFIAKLERLAGLDESSGAELSSVDLPLSSWKVREAPIWISLLGFGVLFFFLPFLTKILLRLEVSWVNEIWGSCHLKKERNRGSICRFWGCRFTKFLWRITKNAFNLTAIYQGGDVGDAKKWQVDSLDLGDMNLISSGKPQDPPLQLNQEL